MFAVTVIVAVGRRNQKNLDGAFPGLQGRVQPVDVIGISARNELKTFLKKDLDMQQVCLCEKMDLKL